MEQLYYLEMKTSFEELQKTGTFIKKRIFLFGHCNATEELADLFIEKGCGNVMFRYTFCYGGSATSFSIFHSLCVFK